MQCHSWNFRVCKFRPWAFERKSYTWHFATVPNLECAAIWWFHTSRGGYCKWLEKNCLSWWTEAIRICLSNFQWSCLFPPPSVRSARPSVSLYPLISAFLHFGVSLCHPLRGHVSPLPPARSGDRLARSWFNNCFVTLCVCVLQRGWLSARGFFKDLMHVAWFTCTLGTDRWKPLIEAVNSSLKMWLVGIVQYFEEHTSCFLVLQDNIVCLFPPKLLQTTVVVGCPLSKTLEGLFNCLVSRSSSPPYRTCVSPVPSYPLHRYAQTYVYLISVNTFF